MPVFLSSCNVIHNTYHIYNNGHNYGYCMAKTGGGNFTLIPYIYNIRQFQDLVRKESEKIEKQRIIRQVFISMTEIVFKVISLVFKSIKCFVFNLPSCPAAFNQFDNIVLRGWNISCPAVVISCFIAFLNIVYSK